MFWIFIKRIYIYIYIYKGKVTEFDLINNLIRFVCKNNKNHAVSNVTNSPGKLNLLEMKTIRPLLTNHNLFFGKYTKEAFIKETYEENFGTAYETYKQSV